MNLLRKYKARVDEAIKIDNRLYKCEAYSTGRCKLGQIDGSLGLYKYSSTVVSQLVEEEKRRSSATAQPTPL